MHTDTFKETIKNIGLSDVKEILDIIKSIRPKTSTSISQITDQSGNFYYIKYLMKYNHCDIYPNDIDNLFNLRNSKNGINLVDAILNYVFQTILLYLNVYNLMPNKLHFQNI